MERRDKRGGNQVGSVKKVPKGVEVDIRFSAPNPGPPLTWVLRVSEACSVQNLPLRLLFVCLWC